MSLLIWLVAFSFCWGAVLWLAASALQRAPSVSGALRQWIWRGAMLLLLAPWIAAPFVSMLGLGLARPEAAQANLQVGPPPETPAVASHIDVAAFPSAVIENGGGLLEWLGNANFAELVLMALIAGWLVRFVMAQLALRSLLGIVNTSHDAGPGPAQDALKDWSRRLKLARTPRLRTSPSHHSPFSYGVVSPVISLPEGIEDRLSRDGVDLVVGHECAHVARGDGWLRPIERIGADLLWFNPFAWLMRRELDLARELACDEAVIAMSKAPRAYAVTLRDVARLSVALPLAAPAASMSLTGGSLMLRVTRTLAGVSRQPARATLFGAIALLLAGAPLAVAQVMFATPAPEAPPLSSLPSPPAPPAPPAAVYSTTDGKVLAAFAATVTAVSGDTQSGYTVELEQAPAAGADQDCKARMSNLGSLSVAQGDRVAEGDVVGQRGALGPMTFAVSCGGDGGPWVAPSPPAPPEAPLPSIAAHQPHAQPVPAPVEVPVPAPLPAPAPPAPPAPVSGLAPIAPVAPVAPLSAPDAPDVIAPPAPQPPSPPHRFQGAISPVVAAPARTTSGFGEHINPISNVRQVHDGIDIASHRGTHIRAPGPGVVMFAGGKGAYGNTVDLEVGNGYVVTFAQLDQIRVREGDRVNAGDVVGTMGASGSATFPHLHLEVRKDGAVIDPAKVAGLSLIGR